MTGSGEARWACVQSQQMSPYMAVHVMSYRM